MFTDTKIKPFENRIWLATPTMHGDELRYITEAYTSNWMTTAGENINEVERAMAEHTGNRYAVALASGTTSLHLSMRMAGIEVYGVPAIGHGALEGHRVFCTDVTFAATVNPVLYEGGIPVFIDAERDSWNMDPLALEQAFQRYPEVKIVVLAHLYGTPAKMKEICDIVEKHGAILVEDAAESLGATYRGRQTGSFGKFNTLSFNGNKVITGSSGGCFLTDSEEAAAKVRKWSTQARENTAWYQHEEIGYNYRMSNVIAGIVRGQIPYLNEHIARKKAIYQRYQERLRDLPVKMNPIPEDCEANYWLSCLVVDENTMCEQIHGAMDVRYNKERGKTCPAEILEAIDSINAEGRPIWKPMHMQPVYHDCPYVTIGETSVGEDIFRRGLCLPSDIKMTDQEQDRIIEAIRACFD